MNQADTAHLYREWQPGMAVTLSLYKKLTTPSGATSDPFAVPVKLSKCRKRQLTHKMVLAYGSLISLSRDRLFEIWPVANSLDRDIVSEQDILQEDNGVTPAAWSETAGYMPGNLVTLDGEYYLCKVANLNQTPPNTSFWKLAPRWTVFAKPETIFDNCTLALCVPE